MILFLEAEQSFPIAHVPTRAEQRQQKYNNDKPDIQGSYDDLKPMLMKHRATMVRQEEILPKGDMATFSDKEWKAIREKERNNPKSHNTTSNTTYFWH